jgi:hypothetical protein
MPKGVPSILARCRSATHGHPRESSHAGGARLATQKSRLLFQLGQRPEARLKWVMTYFRRVKFASSARMVKSVSSTYCEMICSHAFSGNVIPTSSPACTIVFTAVLRASPTSRNKYGTRGQPWRTPRRIGKDGDSPEFYSTVVA